MGLSLGSRLTFYWVLTVSILITLGLRLYVNWGLWRTNANIAIADLCIIMSVTLIMVETCSFTYTNVIRETNPNELFTPKDLKLAVALGFFYTIAVWMIKVTFMSLYFSLKRHLTPLSRNLLYGTAAFTFLSLVANILMYMLWCLPIKRQWIFPGTEEESFCSPNFALPPVALHMASNIGSDLMITFLGILIVANLQMTKRQKYAVTAVVLIGLIPPIASVLRFSKIYVIAKTGELSNDSTDTVEMWIMVDWVFASHAACLPALRAFLRRTTDGEISGGYRHHSSPKERSLASLGGIHVSKAAAVSSSHSANSDDKTELLVLGPVNSISGGKHNRRY